MKIKFRATLGTLKRKDLSGPRLTRWIGYVTENRVYVIEPIDKNFYKIVPDSKIEIIGATDLGEIDQTVLLSMDDIDLPTLFPTYSIEELWKKMKERIENNAVNQAKALALSEYMFMPYFLEGYEKE